MLEGLLTTGVAHLVKEAFAFKLIADHGGGFVHMDIQALAHFSLVYETVIGILQEHFFLAFSLPGVPDFGQMYAYTNPVSQIVNPACSLVLIQ